MKNLTSGHYRVVVGALDDGTPFNLDFTNSLDEPLTVEDDVAKRFEGDPHVFIYDVETGDGDNTNDDNGQNEPPNDGGSSDPDGDDNSGEEDDDQDENLGSDNAPEGDTGTTETKSDAQPAATEDKPKNKGGRPKGSTSSNGSGKRRTTLDG